MLENLKSTWSSLHPGQRRTILALAIILDALSGLLDGRGSLNLLDWIAAGGIPNDMVWLLQVLESICGSFFLIKILFDNVPESNARSLGIALSPLFLLGMVWLTLDFLFKGLADDATITIDLVSIGVGTLTWSSTYLAIAVGLTLTYKVQRYGNFAQSEFFMIGMYLSMVMVWTEHFFPLYDAPRDGTLVWSLLIWTVLGAFILTGFAGILIDRLVYRGFRERDASPQVMMIASLGIALILRAVIYLRFGAGRMMFEPDADWRVPSLRWDIPTNKFRFNIGDRSLAEEVIMREPPRFSAAGSRIGDPMTAETLVAAETYTYGACEEAVDPTTGETVMQHITSTGGSKPLWETYDIANDCLTQATTGYAYYKGAMPILIFTAVALLFILLTKTRLGRRMRAVADNPDLAASSGINVEGVQMTSAFLSAGLSGMGGAIFAMTLRFTPETAFTLLLPAFAIIVLGTIGSIPGVIVGSLIVGFVRALSSPILIGIGYPLGRSNYTALDGVMPYIFLIAILMIMPEGIGDAYEKWKVDRLRKRAEDDSVPSNKLGAALAFSPLGALGAHKFQQRQASRGQSMMIVTIAAYFIKRMTDFIGANSFSDGACSQTCQDTEGINSNLQLLTGRSDGSLIPQDTPFTESDVPTPPSDMAPYLHEGWSADFLADLNNSWFDLMNTEFWLLDAFSTLGDIIWPAIPILVWLIAIGEGIYLLKGRDDDLLKPVINILDDVSTPITEWRNSLTSMLNRGSSSLKGPLATFHAVVRSKTKVTRTQMEQLRDTNSFVKSLRSSAPYGRESPLGSWIAFALMFIVLLSCLAWLPVADGPNSTFVKTLQVSNVLVTLSIFTLMAFSLNLHTGVTGMVNFGVIFFVGVGSIVVGILSAPSELHGYDWPVFWATFVAVMIGAAFGWLLAYPTARLRMDYFAIVTISLGEILRVLLAGEPLLRAGSWGSSIGISRYTLPGETWWFCAGAAPMKEPLAGPDGILGTADDIITAMSARDCADVVGIGSAAERIGDLMNLGQPAPYMMLLAIIGVVSLIAIWWLLDIILASPWGRILRAIREDEEVAQHHGHDILTHKAASLALGAAIAAFAGALWAWKLTGFQPNHMMPARSTFLVWAAFIVGGAANNKGMVIGAFIIVLMEFVFNVLVAGQGSSDLPLHVTAERIDSLFEWLVRDSWAVVEVFIIIAIIGLLCDWKGIKTIGLSGAAIFTFAALVMGERSIEETFIGGDIVTNMAYVKVLLVGSLILFSLKFNPKGLLPEVPSRPPKPAVENPTQEGGT
ncbi:MAG: ABC transporter permease [Candidatus Thalassarchaeum sp.]|nr:ABC transporter permease [Candidatus Thalassarchaeum sp.]